MRIFDLTCTAFLTKEQVVPWTGTSTVLEFPNALFTELGVKNPHILRLETLSSMRLGTIRHSRTIIAWA